MVEPPTPPGDTPKIDGAPRQQALVDLSAELLNRLKAGQAYGGTSELHLAEELGRQLASVVDVHLNYFSARRQFDLLSPILAQLDPMALQGATVVDLGCGSLNPFVFSFLLLMLGAERAYAIDVEPIQNVEIAVRALATAAGWLLLEPQRVLARPDRRELVPEDLLRNLKGFQLPLLAAGDPGGIAPGRLLHRVESVHGLSLRNGEADAVFSMSLLQHVDRIEDALESLRRVTKPGGLGIHVVDFVDHRIYSGEVVSPFEFLKEQSEASLVHGCNRIRCDELSALFEQHGFVVDRVERWANYPPPKAEEQAQFAEPYRSMSVENLKTTGARLFVRRAGASRTKADSPTTAESVNAIQPDEPPSKAAGGAEITTEATEATEGTEISETTKTTGITEATESTLKNRASSSVPSVVDFKLTPDPGAGELDSTRQAYQTLLATASGERGSEYVELEQRDRPSDHAPVTLIAFYLPQFHPIPENDAWWGAGFTEWTNVAKAVPQFIGHHQPHLPGELGFYDLRVPEVLQRQVELARKYGISGFCFYYYWFAGKRLLERPLTGFMADPAIDFPFCLCWANENWTRRWDGREDQILIEQQHSDQTDVAFIADIEPALRHKRYIRIHGRPVLMVYRPLLLRDPAATAARWREYCRKAGLGNPYLVAAEVFETIEPATIGFDAAVEFPPNTAGLPLPKAITPELSLVNPDYAGSVYRYSDMMRLKTERPAPAYQLFKTVCPGFDNEPRRPGCGSTYAFSSPATYGRWLETSCRTTSAAEPDPAKRLVFINAWNEWGEGAHLEPDRRHGYAYLDRTARVLEALSQDWKILFVSHDACRGGAQLVLLELLAWLKAHTSIGIKVLCLEGGEWLTRFQELADTALMPELVNQAARAGERDITDQLLDFCGGKPGLIYGNSIASGRAYPALRKLNAPIVTHVHELEASIKRYAADSLGDVLALSAHYIACSGAVADNLVATHRIAPTSISTIHSWIRDSSDAVPLDHPARVAVRRRLGLPVDSHIVMGCGIGMPFRKGADLFIEVGRDLQRQGRHDIHLYWIGEFPGDESDALHGSWSAQLAQLQTSDAPQVTFLGLMEDPRLYLRAADVFLLTSREDPFPLVALEAAVSGVPIICFDKAGGMPAFVEQDAGRIVPFEDVASMAAQVVALVADESQRHALGLRAREKVLSRFTTNVAAPHVLSTCRLIARQKPALSVIVPNYNHARYLTARLSSIFNQTYRDFEVLLLDDGSSDNSGEVLEAYRDRADVRIVRNESNSGSTFKQWLKGFDLARADCIWIAESDDFCEPEFVEVLLAALRDPRVKIAYANSHVVNERGDVVGDYTSNEYLTSVSPTKWEHAYQVPAAQEVNDGFGVKNTILSASSVIFRKFDLDPVTQRQLESMNIAGDWLFFAHAMADGEVYYTPRKLNCHRRHDESVIGKLLKQNRVEEFFREFYAVQNSIFERYHLVDGFESKWEQYLRDQWNAFFPDRPFEDLNRYYPVSRARELIAASRSAPPSE